MNYGQWRASQLSEKPNPYAFITVIDGAHMWAESINKDSKLGGINAHMIHLKDAGWVLPLGEVAGRVTQDIMDMAHEEALAMQPTKPLTTAAKLTTAGWVKVRSAGECGEAITTRSSLIGLACIKRAVWSKPGQPAMCAQHALLAEASVTS